MAIINLRDFYPWYTRDEFLEVSDMIADELLADKRYHKAHMRQMYRYKAQYSLDAGDGIETEATFSDMSPYEVLEYKRRFCLLCHALNSLPETQGKRIEARYILGMSVTAIAQADGVGERNVRKAINRGLEAMKVFLKKHD